MNISTNQVLQFYLVDAQHPAEVKTVNTVDGERKVITFTGADGKLRSDYIDPKLIKYCKVTDAEMTARKAAVVELKNDPVAGEHYVLTVNFSGYVGNEDTYHKFGDVYVTPGMTKAQFNVEMVKSLLRNLTEYSELFEIYSGVEEETKITLENVEDEITGDGFVIVEPEPYWKLGQFAQTPMLFTVSTNTIVDNSVEVADWATIDYLPSIFDYPNSKKIADLEHFAMGERGAQTVKVGYPYNTEFTYLVNPNSETGYAMGVIHYAYEGYNHDAHLSEKDIVIVSETKSLVTAIVNAVTSADNG